MREAEVGLRSTDTIKFYFKKAVRTFEREAFALKVGDRGTKNSLARLQSSTGGLLDQVGGCGGLI
jgi:hypothetical protein